MVGTEAARNQLPKLMMTPCSAANAVPIGLAPMAVSHKPDERESPAIVVIIR